MVLWGFLKDLFLMISLEGSECIGIIRRGCMVNPYLRNSVWKIDELISLWKKEK